MYVPLRVHGHHSMLTGVDAPAVLLERARALGLPALALADVDTLAGLVDFLVAARAAGVRPIVAAEISDPTGEPGRLIALVRDAQGYRNLCKLVSARQLGGDPGEAGARLDGPEGFRLIESAARWSEGLIFLADHPRLLIGLHGRIDARDLFAAVSPAALQKRGARSRGGARSRSTFVADMDGRRTTRNAHLAPPAIVRETPPRETPLRETEDGDDGRLEPPKVPPPERAVPASELVAAARAVGVATLAVPDVYHAFPEGAEDHRVRVAIKHNALAEDLPAGWTAERPAHLLSAAEMVALFADLPEVPGPFRDDARASVPLLGARARTGLGAGARTEPGVCAPTPAVPGALARTLAVAERCAFAPELGGVIFPTVEPGPGETAYSKLCGIAFDGARRRYRPLKPEVVRRLDYELATIDRLGFSPYFVLVKHLADHARAAGIPCVGRGSAADSLVAYCLELTDADPLRYGLLFERFLNPARRDRPDIDLDFCWRRRDEIIEHLGELFGAERTAMIATLNRCGLRAAFREAALALGLPPAEVNRWSRRLPHYATPAFDGTAGADADEPGVGAGEPRSHAALHGAELAARREDGHVASSGTLAPADGPAPPAARHAAALPAGLAANPIALALLTTPEAAGFPFDDERFARALRVAARLVDTPRHFGLHPGGVVVAPGPITDYVACQRAAKGVLVTQLDKDAVEAIGLVKMDLLGNRALTVIDDCVRALERDGVSVDLAAIPEDDPATARLLREGRTIGCFQVESPGMRNLLKQTGAATMDDVIQAVALIRPGPAGSGMKDAYVRRFRGREDPAPPHPRLTDVLWDTRGVMLYQEDVMRVAERIAGMDLAEADLLRRALVKRPASALEPLRERFLAGARDGGVERGDALRVWELVQNFASFGFCKAHAVTYGRIAYRTVWLKAHHPAEFLAAFLASETGYYAARVYVEEARRLGAAILGPDVNRSGRTFAHERLAGGAAGLRIGLGQVKGISKRTLDAVLHGREAGLFLSLPDFLERTGAHTDEAESLIRCGAFDTFDRTQPELLWRLHLLRAPERRPPLRDGRPLDPGQLAACRATPASRARDAVRAARAQTGGWSQPGLGLGGLRLGPGESAVLFPAPETPALALPRLPDVDARTRGRAEHEILGLTVRAHPTRLFPCSADERIRASVLSFAPCAPGASPKAVGTSRSPRGAGGVPPPMHAAGAPCPHSDGPPVGVDGLLRQDPRETGPQGRPRNAVLPVNPIDCRDLDRFEGGRVTLRGWPAASRRVRTGDGRWMRFLTIEDESGLAEAVLFPDVYERDGHLLAELGTLCVTGIVENQLGACTLHAERVW